MLHPLFKHLSLCAALSLSLSAAGCSDNNTSNNDPKCGQGQARCLPDMSSKDMPADLGKQDMPTDMPPQDMDQWTDEQRQILGVQESARQELEGLDGPVHVVYTEGNVPHVYATTRHDMGYVLGYIVARDRYFVMDLQRRLAQGRIAEILGQDGLQNDLESRQMGMAYVTQKILDGLTPEDAAYLDAYAKGINVYIDQVAQKTAKAPSELRIIAPVIGVRDPAQVMQPFERRDIAGMIAVIMYETNFETGDVGRAAKAKQLATLFEGAPEQELRRQGAQKDLWERLQTIYEDASTQGWGIERGDLNRAMSAPLPSSNKPAKSSKKRALPQANTAMLDRAHERLERMKGVLGRKDTEIFGSNTWAVAGAHTRDGAAVVAGDGHLPLSVPSLMYQVGLNTKLFGDGDIHQSGLLITSLPMLAVGTNGKVAWSQVNPVSDITDWYREELTLDAQGAPASTLFRGEQKQLQVVQEKYTVADIPALDSVGREETWARYVTFDGRFIYDVEGQEVAADYTPAAGETVVNVGGKLIVPKDMDNDGKITAISFDYTAFDTTGYVRTLERFGHAQDVFEFQEHTKGLIGNMLYSAVVDDQGNALFSAYQAVPCRTYLTRDAQGKWQPDADPTMLIDGTTYGGFTIPSDAQGRVDEAPGQTDPYKCVVPFDQTPQAINPASGYVFNANNQPAPITVDGSLENDPWYIGGPWSSFRAHTIATKLQEAVANKTADVAKMAEIQANSESRLGEIFSPYLLQAIAKARSLSETDGPITPEQQRFVATYIVNKDAFDEVEQRLKAWGEQGYLTPSGVETFYHTPAAEDGPRAVATMIFNAWLPRFVQEVFNDEPMDAAYRYSGIRMQLRALNRFLKGRDAQNSEQLASYNPVTQESIFFDKLQTPEIELSDELMLVALSDALHFLRSPQESAGVGGFGTEDMDQWIWGLRHQVRFESLLSEFLGGTDFQSLINRFSITTGVLPLADTLPDTDPRKGIRWFPRPGDNYGVDAANPGFSGTNFTHGSGPVMRMVIALKDGKVWGQNIVPGGQSGLNDSPYFADQAKLWLGNKTLPLRFHPTDVAQGATGREVFAPKAQP